MIALRIHLGFSSRCRRPSSTLNNVAIDMENVDIDMLSPSPSVSTRGLDDSKSLNMEEKSFPPIIDWNTSAPARIPTRMDVSITTAESTLSSKNSFSVYGAYNDDLDLTSGAISSLTMSEKMGDGSNCPLSCPCRLLAPTDTVAPSSFPPLHIRRSFGVVNGLNDTNILPMESYRSAKELQ